MKSTPAYIPQPGKLDYVDIRLGAAEARALYEHFAKAVYYSGYEVVKEFEQLLYEALTGK
jgi:hypothetical protein